MISDFWEDFLLLRREEEPDGLGGVVSSWSEEVFFLGGLTTTRTVSVRPAGVPMALVTRVLTHEPGVILHPQDRVKRVRDGAVWQVLGDSREDMAPARCHQPFAQVPVERLVEAG